MKLNRIVLNYKVKTMKNKKFYSSEFMTLLSATDTGKVLPLLPGSVLPQFNNGKIKLEKEYLNEKCYQISITLLDDAHYVLCCLPSSL